MSDDTDSDLEYVDAYVDSDADVDDVEAECGSDTDIDLDSIDTSSTSTTAPVVSSAALAATDPLSLLANGCDHLDTVKEAGSIVCCKCGLQLSDTLIDTEQRYYTPGDTTNPNRHHIRRNDARSLFADLEKHSFPKPVIELANTYYTQIIDGQIYRAKMRTSIVFACVFNAFKALKEPRSPEDIARIFKLDKKGISRGLKMFSGFFKGTVNNEHINAMHLVPKLLADLNISNPLILEDLTKIYGFVEKSSQLYKSSTPQSVAAGLIWYYLKKAKIDMTKPRFSKAVGLTDITFMKLADETAKRLN
jgi:transcription initiation factor TFIIIB Brf1 subunit/transcription initiation factor TFIIB